MLGDDIKRLYTPSRTVSDNYVLVEYSNRIEISKWEKFFLLAQSGKKHASSRTYLEADPKFN